MMVMQNKASLCFITTNVIYMLLSNYLMLNMCTLVLIKKCITSCCLLDIEIQFLFFFLFESSKKQKYSVKIKLSS